MVNLTILRACGVLLVIFIMADYAAEIEVWSDGEEREEVTSYDKVQDYLANSTYPGSLVPRPHPHGEGLVTSG